MGRKAKLLQKLRGNPNNVSFEDLDKLLLWCGFERRHGSGSHYSYTCPGMRYPLTVPRHKPVKKHYVVSVIEAVELYGDLDED